jgi:hypothetical protein
VTWQVSSEAISVSQSAVTVREAGRYFYVGMAVLFIAVAVAGFAPRSLAIVAGNMPVPPPIIHVHAASMTAWLLMFLAQTLLMSNGRAALHASLGALSFVLAPLITLTLATLVVSTAASALDAGAAMPPDAMARIVAFAVFVMGRAAILFPVFWLWAVAVRKSDPETHKRLMVLAVFVVIDAALGRMGWLPGASANMLTSAEGYTAIHGYQLLLLVPPVAYDMLRFGRVHFAYLLGGGLFLAFALTTYLVWNAPGWHRLVASWAGVT